MEASDGDFARVQSPSVRPPPPPQRIHHQTTFESDLYSADGENPLDDPYDDDDEFDDDASDRLSPVVMRSQRRISSVAIGVPADTLQSIEYGTPLPLPTVTTATATDTTTAARTAVKPGAQKTSWRGAFYSARRTSETVRLSALPDHTPPFRSSLETGITITATMGNESPAILAARGGGPGAVVQKRSNAPSYVHGSYRLNSYFAIRLLRIMQLVVVLDIAALVGFYGSRGDGRPTTNGVLYVPSPLVAIFSRGHACATTISLAAMVYHLVPAVIILGLPASGFAVFEPFKREDRIGRGGRIQKVKRTIYLQVCEMTAVLLFLITGLMAVVAAYHLVVGELLTCSSNSASYLFSGLALVVYVLIYVEIRYFMRFREHLKMQLGAFSEADQTGDVKAHMLRSKLRRKRVQEALARAAAQQPHKTNGDPNSVAPPPPPPVRPPPRSQIVEFVRKRLYRGAQLGDIRLLKRTLRIAKNHLGPTFAKDMYPDAQIRLWFYSTSTKHPMHVAAYHGNIPAMELLYRANFSLTSFDKISRFRFSTGDLFWYLARSFIRQPVMSAEDSYGASAIFKSTLVTPLHCAVSTGRVDAVRWLLQHGADVNLCSRSSFRHESRLPPIFLADHPEIAKELLAAGANHLVIPDPGHMNTITVLQMAYLRGNYAVAQVLENWGGDVALTPLHAAAAMNNTLRIRHLLRKKVNPDCLGELGYIGLNKRTPLHWACVNGAIDAVELLLGAKANADAQDARGRTPLHWAARVSQVEAVKVLLDHGADPNIVDDGGMTPILCAACAGGTTAEMFKMLVHHGANINHQLPSTGDTALHIAVKLDDLPTAVALLSVGGDIMRMNHHGLRPIDCTTSTRLQFEIKRAAGNRDVMISYTHSHKEFALKLRKTLEDANITTWLDLMDPSGIGGGAVWREEIARGVTNAAVVVCILTEDYAASQWCMKELALAKQVGTPILAISTEHAKISEELQVYLYTRQIIPFEASITAVERLGGREIQYQYNEEAFKQQARLLLDGLRDEIEKRKEQVLRKNLSRAATASTMMNSSHNNLTALANTLQGGANGVGSTGRSRGGWQPGSTKGLGGGGGVTSYSNPAGQFDERAAAALQQERMMFEDTNRDGFLYSSAHFSGLREGGRGGHGRTTTTMLTTMQRRDLFDNTNGSMLSVNSDAGGLDGDPNYRELGLNDLSKSIILNPNGYYVHNPKDEDDTDPPASLQRQPSMVSNGTVLETFKDVKDIVDDGQHFVFICHADSHTTFVRRLCAALCREGGLHCYVDRRHTLGRTASRTQDPTTPSPPHSQGDRIEPESHAASDSDRNEDDMMNRIHDAKDAILKCSAFIVIISDKTLRSHLVKDQLAFAEDKGKKIIPIVANALEFSLDLQYSLARSDFFHFLTSGDMLGFEKSLDHVLSTLREEIYGISIEPLHHTTMSLNRRTTSFSNLSQLSSLGSYDSGIPSSFSGHGGDAHLRRRHGGSSFVDETSRSISSSHGWMEPATLNRTNLSFISASSNLSGGGGVGSGGLPPTPSSRSLNTDMSLQQAMLGNFSTIMRSITDEFDDDDEEDDEGDDLVEEAMLEEELEAEQPDLLRSVSETDSGNWGGSIRSSSDAEASQSQFGTRPVNQQPRPGRLSAILSTSNRSVSILERASDDEARSIDGVKMLTEKSPVMQPK